jgi:hypothetical protein
VVVLQLSGVLSCTLRTCFCLLVSFKRPNASSQSLLTPTLVCWPLQHFSIFLCCLHPPIQKKGEYTVFLFRSSAQRNLDSILDAGHDQRIICKWGQSLINFGRDPGLGATHALGIYSLAFSIKSTSTYDCHADLLFVVVLIGLHTLCYDVRGPVGWRTVCASHLQLRGCGKKP